MTFDLETPLVQIVQGWHDEGKFAEILELSIFRPVSALNCVSKLI